MWRTYIALLVSLSLIATVICSEKENGNGLTKEKTTDGSGLTNPNKVDVGRLFYNSYSSFYNFLQKVKIVSYDTFSTYLTLPRKDYGVYFNSSTGAYSDLQTFVGAALLFGAGAAIIGYLPSKILELSGREDVDLYDEYDTLGYRLSNDEGFYEDSYDYYSSASNPVPSKKKANMKKNKEKIEKMEKMMKKEKKSLKKNRRKDEEEEGMSVYSDYWSRNKRRAGGSGEPQKESRSIVGSKPYYGESLNFKNPGDNVPNLRNERRPGKIPRFNFYPGQPTNPTPRSQIQSISAQDWADVYGTTTWPGQQTVHETKTTLNTEFPVSQQLDSSVLNDIYSNHGQQNSY
ncbi:uncharacterized protein LOC111695482 [Eurytemora carolleeae]|uniref:uncharacterized protein LOC111695482 n=1 Tax=Eurytemora carolleeae TaxID=1294199 RepID=UPI000C77F076|nr:uncharacterized protein LOC111695482 [Eurytemora carolleeae]|eukprot:XP_023320594.1 uncharacterized protein LOC111695482 [Eurytemora affinis]